MVVGKIVSGKVDRVATTHVIVKFKNGYEGMCHISKISDYFVNNIQSMFKVGEEHKFEVISVNEEEKRVKLNWKNIHPRFLKNPFEYEVQETENGFKNLKENTEGAIEND